MGGEHRQAQPAGRGAADGGGGVERDGATIRQSDNQTMRRAANWLQRLPIMVSSSRSPSSLMPKTSTSMNNKVALLCLTVALSGMAAQAQNPQDNGTDEARLAAIRGLKIDAATITLV